MALANTPRKRPVPAAERMRRYRARRREAGLTLERRWVPVRAPVAASPYSDHRRLDARSLVLHALIAHKLVRDPRILDRARRTLDRWRTARGDEPAALTEWRAILKRPRREVAALLVDPGENATRLRQSSPFTGVLTAAERRRIYEAFRA
jgi:hypothetical protein